MTTLHQDPNWPRAGTWLRGELAGGTLGRLAVVGVPVHRGSITPGRCDLAPAAIRAALDRFSTFDIDEGVDLLDLSLADLGDLDVAGRTPEEAVDSIREAVTAALPNADAVILLGGDNSITYPGAAALDLGGLITFDAHLDLRSLDGGLTNGNPVRALLSKGFPGDRIVQIGIQAFANSKAYLDVALDAGVTVISAEQVREQSIRTVVHTALQSFTEGSIYVDVDLDVLDSAFAPASPGSRPGGLTPSDLLTALRLCGEYARVHVLDLVEIDPERDIGNRTALCAAACLLSFASGVHLRCSRLSVARNL